MTWRKSFKYILSKNVSGFREKVGQNNPAHHITGNGKSTSHPSVISLVSISLWFITFTLYSTAVVPTISLDLVIERIQCSLAIFLSPIHSFPGWMKFILLLIPSRKALKKFISWSFACSQPCGCCFHFFSDNLGIKLMNHTFFPWNSYVCFLNLLWRNQKLACFFYFSL